MPLQKELRRVSYLTCARAIPQLASMFQQKVPEEYWARTDDDTVEISCPCGETAVCRFAIPEACECDRWFLYDGMNLRVQRLTSCGQEDGQDDDAFVD